MGNVVRTAKRKGRGIALANKKITIVFVLGGPGSGKGTQCTNIAQRFGYTHLSVGELLRSARDCASENWNLTAAELDMINKMMAMGAIVPSDITIKLLEHAMLKNDNNKFLIDGFPRNEENRAAFESLIGIEPEFILFFDCSEEEMERRLLSRNQGRADDTIDTIKKRFKVYLEDTLPVIEYYNSKGKVRKIDATKPIDEVFDAVKACFTPSADKVVAEGRTE